MKRRIFNSAFATEHRRERAPSVPDILRHAARPPSFHTFHRALPPGTLWDPTLLDRLQTPLTRLRE